MMKTALLLLTLISAGLPPASKPNIVFVITDDQGYGDLACNGNPVVKTPNIDQLASQSSGLTNYHVAPTCSPSRSALQTGHWTDRTGVWHTVNGRSMLRENEVTMGQMLKDAGYATGMFGKWHLGDNYPYRPEDRGFSEVYRHGGGGVGQTPDVWDNAYFDGAYFHNGQMVPAKGFCTDVFFAQANKFITDCAQAKKPFLAYISLNAPHGPLHAPQKYMDMYADQPDGTAAFFGMITNIDDNLGKTRKLLTELGIHENTIFIFTTDNGTAGGANVFNAGMRGMKGSEYDGGHRVPFFLHWPAGKMDLKHRSEILTHAVDVLPTLLDLVGAQKPESVTFDGRSIRTLLDPKAKVDWADRFLVTDSQRVRDPIKWKQTAVMSQSFRLVNGEELYDMTDDPGQQTNVAAEHPEQMAAMRRFYDEWWAELEPTFAQTTEIYLGHAAAPVVTLTAHDWIQGKNPPWSQVHIRNGEGLNTKTGNEGLAVHRGHWAVKVITPGNYQFALRRWPPESKQAINVQLPAGENVPGASKAYRARPGVSIAATEATLRIDDKDLETKPVSADAEEVLFTTTLESGSHQLAPVFHVAEGELGAYYVIVSKLD